MSILYKKMPVMGYQNGGELAINTTNTNTNSRTKTNTVAPTVTNTTTVPTNTYAPEVSQATKMELFAPNKPMVRTAQYTPNEYRPRTKVNTIDTLVKDFGMTREEANAQYSPELLDSLASTNNRFKYATSSTGQPVLNEYIPNRNKTVQFKKGGQNRTC